MMYHSDSETYVPEPATTTLLLTVVFQSSMTRLWAFRIIVDNVLYIGRGYTSESLARDCLAAKLTDLGY